jgi:Mn2+/Fe2+ NRAMP family transporter
MSDSAQIEPTAQVERDRRLLKDAQAKGFWSTLGAFVRLSGPGWLQSAITLGGGTLAGSLYLGVILGYESLWLQLVAIICGVIMLSAIGYVTLSTGQRPFRAINQHINPVLGWSWALATFAANIVWALPQFALATAATTQNLLPAGSDSDGIKMVIAGSVLVVCVAIVWLYDSGGWGIKAFELLLKAMVAVIVISFFGVLVKLATSSEGLDWAAIGRGFVPDLSVLTNPSPAFASLIEQLSPAGQSFWTPYIIDEQRNIMMGAVATAVGINMTFLLPYSMLARGWDKTFRGLAVFDLATGMAIPFIIVTSCVVIASSSRFHAQLPENEAEWFTSSGMKARYDDMVDSRLAALNPDFQPLVAEKKETGKASPEYEALRAELLPTLDITEKKLSAMTVKRDASDLAPALAPLVGETTANLLFGIGVVGMAISTIIILMLISGFVVCEMVGAEQGGWVHRIGVLFPAIGVLGPFFWKGASVYLAVPTSVFGLMLIPIAYITFFAMMNSKALMGDKRPKGLSRVIWNVLMGFATALATAAASYAVWDNTEWYGVGFVAGLVLLAIIVHFLRPAPPAPPVEDNPNAWPV